MQQKDPIPARNFGLLDNRFLSRSVGLLEPRMPITLTEDEPLEKALILLQENKVGCVTVTNLLGQVRGIFTERDVLLKVISNEVDFDAPISTYMTTEPQTLEMTTPIAYALQMMSEGGYRHMPIIDDENYPVGTLSVKNIIDYIVRQTSSELDKF